MYQNGHAPDITLNVGDRVRVTMEYAAWYREHYSAEPTFTPETDLIVDALLAGDRLNVREDRRWYHTCDIPSRFLVSAEAANDTATAD